MLIYNSQKEFIGIDETDLSTLGFPNLAQLRSESADFADLFVKTPGYIHNFKHVHWIDFIVCADSVETPKVIIHANEKNYRCNLNITSAYLTDNPSAKAYLVNLQNLRELSKTESLNITNDIQDNPIPVAAPEEIVAFNTIAPSAPIVDIQPTQIIQDNYETPNQLDNATIIHDQYDDAPLQINLEDDNDTPLNIDIDDETSEHILLLKDKELVADEPLLSIIEEDEDYVFNPHLASDELGLPIDLIEEFIEDFIAQAKEFKNSLYDSLKDADINNVKILSHKLKGVAANLRIEDAFDVLTIINTSEDTDIIHKNLNYFYKIVTKLAGEEMLKTPIVNNDEEEPESKIEEDLYMDRELTIDDSHVPQTIDIPELADDDFVSEEIIEASYDKAQVADEIGIDSESFNELFEDYINESKELSTAIIDAIELNDSQKWKYSALKLKGMSDNMRVHNFTSELELLLKTSSKDEALNAANKIISVISKISTEEA